MAERQTSESLHSDELTTMAIDARLGGPPAASKAAQTPIPMTPHSYTMQWLISIVRNSQSRSPLYQNK